jgi:hypothetical protein
MGTAIFSRTSFFHFSTTTVSDELRPIADTEYRYPSHKLRQVNFESLRVVDGERRAAKDDTNDRGVIFGEFIIR